jgi:hypothetical protein
MHSIENGSIIFREVNQSKLQKSNETKMLKKKKKIEVRNSKFGEV